MTETEKYILNQIDKNGYIKIHKNADMHWYIRTDAHKLLQCKVINIVNLFGPYVTYNKGAEYHSYQEKINNVVKK